MERTCECVALPRQLASCASVATSGRHIGFAKSQHIILYLIESLRPNLLSYSKPHLYIIEVNDTDFTMLFLLPLFFAATVAASPIRNGIAARDGAAINDAIQTISDQTITLNKTLTEFNASLEGTIVALKILDQADKLGKAIDEATTITKGSDSLDDTESTAVAYSTVELSRNVYDVLDHIVAKKPDFDKAIFGVGSGSFLVKGSLETLRSKTAVFGSTLEKKLVEKIAELAPLILATIDFSFEKALEVYQ